MQIRWSPDAAADLENIVDYIAATIRPSLSASAKRECHSRGAALAARGLGVFFTGESDGVAIINQSHASVIQIDSSVRPTGGA